jgi:hypothetical protein
VPKLPSRLSEAAQTLHPISRIEFLIVSRLFGEREVLDSWSDDRFAHAYYWYSDRSVVARCTFKPEGWLVRSVGKGWSPIVPPGYEAQSNNFVFGFLDDDLLVTSYGKQIAVGTIEGPPLLTQALPKSGPSFSRQTPLQEGRFAVVLYRFRGFTSELIDSYSFEDDRVMVYSVPERRGIFSVKVKGRSPWPPWSAKTAKTIWNGIALSADGQLLGIASNDGVRVYSLPPRQEKH